MKHLPALVLFLSAAVLSPAFGAAIEDPQSLLTTLESNRSKAEFQAAFRKDDKITLRIFNTDSKFACSTDGCGSMSPVVNHDFEKSIVEATPDSATAVSTDGSSEVYDRAEYEAGGKQYLRKSLEGLDVFLGM